MEKIQKGDIVARKSHNLDILFSVQHIIKSSNGLEIAILKGITARIVADAYLSDLEILDKKVIHESLRSLDIKIEDRINKFIKSGKKLTEHNGRNLDNIKSGRILHLDGDKLYAEKTARYYRKMGLNAVVKNVSENKQHLIVKEYINKYNPDVLVLTGHERRY